MWHFRTLVYEELFLVTDNFSTGRGDLLRREYPLVLLNNAIVRARKQWNLIEQKTTAEILLLLC